MAKTPNQKKNGPKQNQKSSKKPQIPEGYARLQFLNKAQDAINNSNLNSNLANKLNLYYGETSQLLVEKYLIKVEPKRKNLCCRRCKGKFSNFRGNFEVEVVEGENRKSKSKHNYPEMLTKCRLCGYVKPKVLRPDQSKKLTTNFREVTS